MSPLCLRGAQLSTPTYLECHAEEAAQTHGGREIIGECEGGREREGWEVDWR